MTWTRTWSKQRPTKSGWYWTAFGSRKQYKRLLYLHRHRGPHAHSVYRGQDLVHLFKGSRMLCRAEQIDWWGPKVAQPA